MSAKIIEKTIEKEIAGGSPKNARKMPHGEAAIEALAGSIAAKGMLQNLAVEPEVDTDGAQTGHYLVTVGEGRRLAQLFRAKSKQIRKSEPDPRHSGNSARSQGNQPRRKRHPYGYTYPPG